ncbi:MAG: hypothetical protein ACI9B9_000516 [Halioglobus sp.]|jgi:hypothetical protein
MLVSHNHKFIYTKTNKTAGTSVESFFEPHCMPNADWQPSFARAETISAEGIVGFRGKHRPEDCCFWNHMPASVIKERLGDDIWYRYFKFCVVRNPFDKAISQFYFHRRLHQGKQQVVERIDLDEERQAFEHWLTKDYTVHDRDKYLINGEFCLDDVIRFENLERDVVRVCDVLSIDCVEAKLSSFMVGIRPAQATTETLYSAASRQIVEEKCSFELECFDYSFPKSS